VGANTFRWTITNGGCTPSTDDVVISVGSAPGSNTITGPTTVSPNQPGVTYSVTPPNPASTYHWTFPAGTVVTGASGPDSSSVTVTFGPGGGLISVTETNPFGAPTTASTTISTGATGISSGLGGDSYVLYPSPFFEQTTIKISSMSTTQMTIKVMDVKGNTVFVNNEYYTNEDVVLGKDLATGVYMVQISYAGKLQVVKMVKL